VTFWLAVAIAYIMILAVGLALGITLAHRHPGNGRDKWDIPDGWSPAPTGGMTADEELRALVESYRS